MTCWATFSEDRVYRYSLHRVWNPAKPVCVWVMLNPSTADETKDDATIRRCQSFARAWGFGGVTIVNLFAFRSTDPKGLETVDDPIGPGNDLAIFKATQDAHKHEGRVVCAWGAHGARGPNGRMGRHGSRGLGRGTTVKLNLRADGITLWCLGLTADKHPKHPVRLAKATQVVPWT